MPPDPPRDHAPQEWTVTPLPAPKVVLRWVRFGVHDLPAYIDFTDTDGRRVRYRRDQ